MQAQLESLGYGVTVQRFRFHPSALLAFPLLGAGLGFLGLLLLPLLAAAAVPGWTALLVWVTGLGAVALLSVGVGLGWVAFGEVREDANLVARRGDGPVARWLVAHLDTKAQAQSMAGRLVAVWMIAAAVAGMTLAAVVRLTGPLPLAMAAPATAAALLAGSLAGRGRLRGRSRGARDNGTGLAALLAAAQATTDPATGILVTGAEEFVLAGARIFAQLEGDRLRGVTAVNFDTLDQEGALFLVSHDGRGETVAAACARRLGGLGYQLRRRRLPAGILVDSLPLARAGADAITVARLSWNTLRLIHTPRDLPEGLSLDPAQRVGRAIAAN